MHTTWPGDAGIHCYLVLASFVALMVVYAHHTWPGDDGHTLLLGAGLFVALMVVYAHRMAG